MAPEDCVCSGRFGFIRTADGEKEGLELQCPDGDFKVQGEKQNSVPEAKRILKMKGCDADIVDETR